MSTQSIDFRPLNLQEQTVLATALVRGRIGLRLHTGLLVPGYGYGILLDSLKVSYQHLPGNFLVCCIVHQSDDKTLLWRGVSRRSYKDRPNRVRGEMLAFSRAVFYSYGVEI